jgi:hypothetical protein
MRAAVVPRPADTGVDFAQILAPKLDGSNNGGFCLREDDAA